MAQQPQAQRHNLPRQPTSFIGRRTEITRLRERLTNPDCRLLTVVGPGGIGKTRLAIEAATAVTSPFSHGVYFAPLQGIYTGDYLVSAVAEAINFSLSGQQEPLAQVLNYLSDKTLLLLLDNFEQLVDQGGPAIVIKLLAAAPHIKLLVTSRETLNLREEWLYPVRGLSVPTTDQPDGSDADDAMQLFIARARQVQPDFAANDERDTILQICRLVEGTPLAVELAASWTKTLSCSAIAAEVQRSLDFLSTPLRNVSDRHRSMAAAFDTSWQLLNENEQHVFKRLSVFRGGFQRTAAAPVAGATLATLVALVDKSLLRQEANDRYQIHELLRQSAQTRLEAQVEDVTQTHQAHCAYYAEFLYQRTTAIEGGDQRGVLLEIEAELENVRAAWQWAITHARVAEIQKLTQTFTVFCYYQSRYLEAANTFDQARACLAGQPPTRSTELALANVLVRVGWFNIPLGHFEAAQAALTQSRALFARLDAAPMPYSGADPLPPLSILATIRGDFDEAIRLGQTARQVHEARNDGQNLAFAHYVLTSARLAQGDYAAAQQHARQACAVAKQAGNRWFLAFCLNEWGNVARALGNYAEAKQHFEASYQIRAAFDDPVGMAAALNHLGEVAIRQGEFSEAQGRYQQSRAIYQESNDRGGLATALNGLGQAACAMKDYLTAADNFQRALTIAHDMQFLPLIGAMFISISELFLKVGQSEHVLELLAFIGHHAASDQETKDRAAQMRKQAEADVAGETLTAARQRGQARDLDAMVAFVHQALASIANPSSPPEKAAPSSPLTSPDHPPLDPLTDRELEVLQLMAAGRSNREIGAELVLALGSVKWYASQIYSKLQVKNRTEAAAKARALKLIF
ncbi:MAG: tetratricopeptide repeat protein [Anaerolineaceae bacterium]|nr:tetratricopeptide repeat protein [Anaerolineaceae bacterium]MCB9098868.1 tetratricopeptide repeat protein [Anaerolineales bacterium]